MESYRAFFMMHKEEQELPHTYSYRFRFCRALEGKNSQTHLVVLMSAMVIQ